MSEILCIARSSCSISIFDEKYNALITRMRKQGENYKKDLKAYENHSYVLQKDNIPNRDIS